MSDAAPIVFVVDDDASFRDALQRLLNAHGYHVESFASALAYRAREPYQGPGCLLLDLAMPGIDGLQLQASLGEDHDALPIIFLSGYAQLPDGVKAMKQGAADFLAKPVDEQMLFEALRSALAQSESRLRRRERLAMLSDREHQVMQLVVEGLRNKQIAQRLGIAEKTAKVHRARVLEKTGVSSVAELVRLVDADGSRITPSPQADG